MYEGLCNDSLSYQRQRRLQFIFLSKYVSLLFSKRPFSFACNDCIEVSHFDGSSHVTSIRQELVMFALVRSLS